MFKFLLVLLFTLSIQAQEPEQKPESSLTEEQVEQINSDQIRTERLLRFRSELITLKSEIYQIEKELNTDIDMVSRFQQETKLTNLKKEYEDKRFKFIQAISYVDLSGEDINSKQSSITEDIKQILDPVLKTFKKISEKPRRIQELNEQQERIKLRLDKANKAKKELDNFLKTTKQAKLVAKTKESVRLLDAMISDLDKRYDDLIFEHRHIEENGESIVSTFSGIIFDFIKTKGKNLVLALIIFALVYWGFKYSQDKVINLFLFKLQRSENRDFYDWLIRPTRVLYSVCTFLVAFFMSILTLYVLNDWVLVTIILITFTALIWSSKQYFPLFFEQSKIVLNLGAIREGERVIYGGIPWKIKGLGYYCRLVNQELEGGTLRVNTKELLLANSRKISPTEPWFPTKKGDWVEMEDTFGQVALQTPEQVVIESIGGEKKYIPTDEFYKLNPKNLSQGFSIEFTFGVDYKHQKIIFTDVIPDFKEKINQMLKKDFPQTKQSLQRSALEFQQAGASSLDIRIFYKFSGELASLKLALARCMQGYLVEACNEKGYVIPFNQLTVHLQNEKS